MAIEILVPRLGWSMEEGTLVRWHKNPGDEVASGDVLFELEGEKAVQEIEAVGGGILYISPETPPPGSVVKVGAVLGYLLAPGEAPPQGTSGTPTASQPAAAEESKQVAPPAAGPAARRRARQLGVRLNEVAGSGRSGQITREDVEQRASTASAANGQKVQARDGRRISTPRARRVAQELGIDWTTLEGSGAGGRIREIDVRNALASAPNGIAADKPAVDESLLVVTPSTRRRAIAENLRRSRDKTVPVTLTTTADVTALVELREKFKANPSGVVPAYTDLMTCLAARVLKHHPQLAMRWNEDGRTLAQTDGATIHVGIAVDTPEGLLVPVVRDVLSKSLPAVVRESSELIARGRAGRLTAAEMQGGMFTISNLGGHGIDAFTPVINYPQVAILGLGAIRREPMFTDDDRVVARQRMVLSLTFDHAAIDGAPAAAFLRDLSAAIENAAVRLIGE